MVVFVFRCYCDCAFRNPVGSHTTPYFHACVIRKMFTTVLTVCVVFVSGYARTRNFEPYARLNCAHISVGLCTIVLNILNEIATIMNCVMAFVMPKTIITVSSHR